MRKLLSLCGVIVLTLLFVCACGNTEQSADVSELEGEWKVGGIYVKGYLIDVNDVEDIAGIYDGYRLTINEDGSFVYLMKIFGYKGTVTYLDESDTSTLILNSAEGFKYVFENGEIVQKPMDDDKNPRKYIAVLKDDNTIEVNEYDPETKAGIADKDPFIFVKKGSDSDYLTANKTKINTDSSSPKSASVGSSSNSASESKTETKKKETAEPFTNAYGTPTTKCAHSGCNNYIASSGDTNCCTLHSKKCLECGKYIDEDAAYCMSCLNKASSSGSSGSYGAGSSSSSSGSKCTFKENGVEVCNNPAASGSPFCSYHKKLLDDTYKAFTEN